MPSPMGCAYLAGQLSCFLPILFPPLPFFNLPTHPQLHFDALLAKQLLQ